MPTLNIYFSFAQVCNKINTLTNCGGWLKIFLECLLVLVLFFSLWMLFFHENDVVSLKLWIQVVFQFGSFFLIQKKSQKCDLFNNFFIGLILRRALNQRAFIWRKFNKIESWQHKMWHSPFANSFSKEKWKCSDNSDFARSKNRKVFLFSDGYQYQFNLVERIFVCTLLGEWSVHISFSIFYGFGIQN